MVKCIKDYIKNRNIVVGCTNNCAYCYARINNQRFREIPDFSKPVFFEKKLKMLDKKTSGNYFLTGMSDLADWEDEWKEIILKKVKENPQNIFLFLTKSPERLDIHIDTENAWFGVTVTCKADIKRIQKLKKSVHGGHFHVTFEPIFEDLGELDLDGIEWIVIGTETGKRKGKIDTKPEWAFHIAEQAQRRNIPVFMKEDLYGILCEEEMIQEFPKEFVKIEV